MTRFGYPPAHRLVVDAYMASHPGDGSDRRDRQSVAVHLVGLGGTFERGWSHETTLKALRATVGTTRDFPRLTPPEPAASLTVASLVGCADLTEYDQRSSLWARAVWDSWSEHHDAIRAMLPHK